MSKSSFNTCDEEITWKLYEAMLVLSVMKLLHLFTGMKVVLVVNNLGGTSNIHLSTMADAAIKHLGK